ncbi:hypothetical protein B7494_g3676 [Chlorociboria aeruginascens]|nr:hypothetical protein B7494_g3676 [Chlorociboria aeruginascens]
MAIQQQKTSGIFARIQRLIDRVVTPETRSQFFSNVSTFAHEQPFLATFLFIQLLLSFTPILLFSTFILSTILFSLLAALIFSLFWIGIMLLVLVPTLFVTVSLGIAAWIWVVGSFLVARWVYNVLPVGVRGTAEVGMPNGKKVVVKKGQEGADGIKGEVVE